MSDEEREDSDQARVESARARQQERSKAEHDRAQFSAMYADATGEKPGLSFRTKVCIAAGLVTVGAIATYVKTESAGITAGVGAGILLLAAAILYLHHLDEKSQDKDAGKQVADEADEPFNPTPND